MRIFKSFITWPEIRQQTDQDEVFVISRIIKVEVRVVRLSQKLGLTLAKTLIILNITKAESNNNLLFFLYIYEQKKKNGISVFVSSLTASNTKHANLT